MSDTVVGIRANLPGVITAPATEQVVSQLRLLADNIERDAYGPIEYGLICLSLASAGAPPSYFGLGDMRRDSAIGLLSMGASLLAVSIDLERV